MRVRIDRGGLGEQKSLPARNGGSDTTKCGAPARSTIEAAKACAPSIKSGGADMSVAQGEDRIDDLIKVIYGTLGQKGQWPRVLDQICDAFGGAGVTRFEHNFGNRKGFIRYRCRHVDASANDAYNNKMCGRNPWLHCDLPYQPEAALLGTEILPNADLVKTASTT